MYRGVSVQGAGLCHGEERAVCILLEWIHLISFEFRENPV